MNSMKKVRHAVLEVPSAGLSMPWAPLPGTYNNYNII